ncbi:SPOR domain-containing protein [Pontibacter ruber]|uniref:SPOR domain-containing protein n=1 Tax=Pontibacter ruber TaxID=1343895 RepID=A0ABW5CSX7_9BACT|nr:SPOR domain-containing protein [Pontibacter ruber]
MVDKHIKSLLYDHDCVIIPDFGGLIARYVSARINPVKHTLAPPSKRIAFNEKLVLSDGLLISTFAHAKGVSHEEAQRLVAEFVHQAKVKLDTENRFELQGIGLFKYNAERRIEFEYVEADNLLEDSFGLPELVARPLRVEEPAVLRTLIKERHQQEPVPVKMLLRRRLKRIYNVTAGLVLGGIAVTGVYLLSLQTDYNLSSLNPISLFNAGQPYNSQLTSKYATDYEPFSEEDRATAYERIIPAYTVAALDEIEAEVPTTDVEDSTALLAAQEEVVESIAASNEAQAEVNQEVTLEEKVTEAPAETKAPVLTINRKTGRFYVITGGYSRLKNAEENRDEIGQKGFAAKVLVPGRGSRLYRVSVADFATAEEAQAAVPALRKTFGETIWVFNN